MSARENRPFGLDPRERVQDAARILPLFGAGLMLLPLWWPPSWGVWWTFGLWTALIVAAAAIAPALARLSTRARARARGRVLAATRDTALPPLAPKRRRARPRRFPSGGRETEL